MDNSITEITTFLIPNGNMGDYLIAIGFASGHVRLLNSVNYEIVREFQNESWPSGIAFSPNGSMIAVAYSAFEVRVWNTSSGELIQALEFPQNYVEAVLYTVDGKKLIGQSDNTDIRIWDTESWELVGKSQGWFLKLLPPDNTPVVSLLHSPEQQDFINPITGSVLFSLPLEPPELNPVDSFYETTRAMAYSSNGEYFAKGSGYGWISIWDLEKQEMINVLKGHKSLRHDGPPNGVYDLAFTPYGYLLASTGIDGTVRLWDIKTGKALWVVDMGRSISNLAFSPDGRNLIVGDFIGNVYVWAISE